MHVTFYRSFFCPRCHLAGKHLLELTAMSPEITVECIDSLTAPVRTWQDGIRMIPALKIGDHILCGFYLSRKNITEFIARHKP